MEEPPDLADFMDLLDELKGQNDRAVAIILPAQLESVLQEAIAARLVPLDKREENRIFGYDGPLGSFSAKIKIGFALGIYGPETRAHLDTIRAIRNTFAHSRKPVTFETPAVAAECAKLRTLNRAAGDDACERFSPPEKPRNEYDAAARILWVRLGRCAAKYKWPPPERCPCLI
jgi:hypothetical protein